MTNPPQSEREAFEAWASREGYSVECINCATGPDGEPVYADSRTHAAWWSWQAALASRTPSPAPEGAQQLTIERDNWKRWCIAAEEGVRVAYKTGYDEGYSDASDGMVDHDACEEGWQQYRAALAAVPQEAEPIPNLTTDERGTRTVGPDDGLKQSMPNPTAMDLVDPMFNAIWNATKTWDVNAPEYYVGYCGLNGSHVMLILNAVRAALASQKGQQK